MGSTLIDAPVVCAIAQIIHNPILSIGDFASPIQEKMRLAGLPGFQQTTQFAIKFPSMVNGQIASGQMPEVDQFKRLVFTDVDQKKSIIVDKDSFTFVVTRYSTFEEFQDDFKKFLAAFGSVISLDYVERIGVRYVDVFNPIVLDDLRSTVGEGILGLSEKLSPDNPIVYSATETRLLLSSAESPLRSTDAVLTRATIRAGLLELPMGIDLSHLKLDPKFLNISGLHVTIDTDGFSESRVAFNPEYVVEKIDFLHRGASVAFHATVTPEAIEVWKQGRQL